MEAILSELTGILIPLGICLVLPVMIVWLVTRVNTNADNKRAQILIEAIKANAQVDTNALARALERPRKTPEEKQQRRLLWGCLLTLGGIASEVCALFQTDADERLSFITMGCFGLALGLSFLIVFAIVRRNMQKKQ